MKSLLLLQRLIIIFTLLFIPCNLVHGVDKYSSPVNYFSFPPGFPEPPSFPPGFSEPPSFPPGFSEPPSFPLSNLGNARRLQAKKGDKSNSRPPCEIHVVAKKDVSSNINPKLKKICEQTDHPDLCLSTIGPRLSGGGDADIKAVLGVAIKASYELAKVGDAKAKKMAMKMAPGNDDESSLINECLDSFDDALDNFDLVLKAFQNHDVGMMDSMLSAVITDMSDCDDDLGHTSPLTKIGDKLANMTANCLAISSQMH